MTWKRIESGIRPDAFTIESPSGEDSGEEETTVMNDAFDQWMEWMHKPPGHRTGLSSDVHASVMFLPEEDRTDRQKVNSAVSHWAELRSTARTAWIYLNDYDNGERRHVGDPEWVKVFTSADAADKWLDKHDPEGVAWECEVEGAPDPTNERALQREPKSIKRVSHSDKSFRTVGNLLPLIEDSSAGHARPCAPC